MNANKIAATRSNGGNQQAMPQAEEFKRAGTKATKKH
jgi:hypothetical protein